MVNINQTGNKICKNHFDLWVNKKNIFDCDEKWWNLMKIKHDDGNSGTVSQVLWMIQMYFDVAVWCKWNRELDRIMIDIYEWLWRWY